MGDHDTTDAQHAVNSTAPFLANIIGLLGCFPVAIVGILFAGSAAMKAHARPAAARRAVRRSWVCFAVVATLFGLLVVFFFATQPEATLGLLGLS